VDAPAGEYEQVQSRHASTLRQPSNWSRRVAPHRLARSGKVGRYAMAWKVAGWIDPDDRMIHRAHTFPRRRLVPALAKARSDRRSQPFAVGASCIVIRPGAVRIGSCLPLYCASASAAKCRRREPAVARSYRTRSIHRSTRNLGSHPDRGTFDAVAAAARGIIRSFRHRSVRNPPSHPIPVSDHACQRRMGALKVARDDLGGAARQSSRELTGTPGRLVP